MGDTLAEQVQLQRAEEQANGARVRWEFRTLERRVDRATPGGKGMGMIGVRLPRHVIDLLARHGMPGVVARGIILRWAGKVAKASR